MDLYKDKELDLEEEERNPNMEEEPNQEEMGINKVSNDGGYHEDEEVINHEAICAQIDDTGAKVLVTKICYALHNYI